MENVILIVFILTTQSSYTNEGESPGSKENFDTIQWWLTREKTFRISTFAKTNDIHIYEIGGPINPAKAIENTELHYGDIIASKHIINLVDASDESTVNTAIVEELTKGQLEIVKHLRTGFWNYDGRKYTTQTEP